VLLGTGSGSVLGPLVSPGLGCVVASGDTVMLGASAVGVRGVVDDVSWAMLALPPGIAAVSLGALAEPTGVAVESGSAEEGELAAPSTPPVATLELDAADCCIEPRVSSRAGPASSFSFASSLGPNDGRGLLHATLRNDTTRINNDQPACRKLRLFALPIAHPSIRVSREPISILRQARKYRSQLTRRPPANPYAFTKPLLPTL
jgi:hypothetical protein